MSSEPPSSSTPARRFRVRPEHLHSAAAAKARQASALEIAGVAPRAAAAVSVEAAGSTASPPSTPRSVSELVTADWAEEEEHEEWARHTDSTPQPTTAAAASSAAASATASQSSLANQLQRQPTSASASAASSVTLDIADAKDDDDADEDEDESEMPLPIPPPKAECMVCGAELPSSVAEQQIHINRCLDLMSNPAPVASAAAAATPARAASAAASSFSSSAAASSSSSSSRARAPPSARVRAPSIDPDVLLNFDDIYEHDHDHDEAEAAEEEERKEWRAPSRSAAAASARARARAAGGAASSSSGARAASSSSAAAASSSAASSSSASASPRTVRLHFDDTPPCPAMESFADLGPSSSSSSSFSAAAASSMHARSAEVEFRALLVAAAAHQRAHANQQREFFVVDCSIKPLPLSEQARADALTQWTASAAAVAPASTPAPIASAAPAASSSSSPPPLAAVPVADASSSSSPAAVSTVAGLDDGFSLGPGLGSLPLHPPLPVPEQLKDDAAAISATAVASMPLPWVEIRIIPTPGFLSAAAAAAAALDAADSGLSLYNPPLSFRQIAAASRVGQPSASELRAHQRRLSSLPPLPPTAAERTTLTHGRLNAAWSRLGTGDRLSRLPDVLFQLVCHYLPPTEVALASSVSHRWEAAANSKQLWRYLCSRSYSKPQARMDSKAYYRYRLTEERRRGRAYDAIPALSVWSRENSQWSRLKSAITALNSGGTGLVHCVCYLVFLILLLMKLGHFFTDSPATTRDADPNRDWTWARVFAPVWVSHALYLLSLASFALMSLSAPFWRALGPEQMGACAWIFHGISRQALTARRKRATQLTATLGAEQAALQVQRENGGRPVWDTRAPLGSVLRVAFGFVLPLQLASVLAVVKLDRSLDCACEYQEILWRHIVAPFLLPFVCVLALLIMTQRDLYAAAALDRRRGHMQLLDQLGLVPGGEDWVAMMDGLENSGGSGCGSRLRRNCCCCLPRSMPDKILFVWMLELTGFIVTAVLVAYTTDVSRDWTINGPSSSRIQRAFWFETAHLGWWVFAPMWFAHSCSALWLQWRFLVTERHHVYWGSSLCVQGLRGFVYFLANCVWNIVIRAPLLTTEILYALNLSAEWGSARGGRFPSSSAQESTGGGSGDPMAPRAGDAQAFDGYTPRVNSAWVALPLVLVLATAVLCVYCPISILEIDKRREEREGMRHPR